MPSISGEGKLNGCKLICPSQMQNVMANIYGFTVCSLFIDINLIPLYQEAVARYVSLIPFVSDSVVFPGLCDIWSTCDVSIICTIGSSNLVQTIDSHSFLHFLAIQNFMHPVNPFATIGNYSQHVFMYVTLADIIIMYSFRASVSFLKHHNISNIKEITSS